MLVRIILRPSYEVMKVLTLRLCCCTVTACRRLRTLRRWQFTNEPLRGGSMQVKSRIDYKIGNTITAKTLE